MDRESLLRNKDIPAAAKALHLIRAFDSQVWHGHAIAEETLPKHLKELVDVVVPVRARAGPAAAQVGPQLLQALEHQECFTVRKVITEAMRKIESSPVEAVPQLAKALEHPDLLVRTAAMQALLEMGAAEAVPQLSSCMQDQSSFVRKWAVEAAGKLGPAAASALPQITLALEDLDWEVRSCAAESLGSIGSFEAVPQLINALQDKDWYVRHSAFDALLKIDPAAAEAASRAPKAMHQPMSPTTSSSRLGFQDTTTNACEHVLKVFSKVGAKAAREVHRLMAALTDHDSDVRAAAAMRLGDMGLAALEVLPWLWAATQDNSCAVRASAAKALGKLGPAASADALPRLMEAMQDESGFVRKWAVEAAGKLGRAAAYALPQIILALEDLDWEVRSCAAQSLGMIGLSEVVPQLTKMLQDEHRHVRRGAVQSLGMTGLFEAVPQLINALGDSNWKVRSCATESLAIIGLSRAVPQLINALQDQHWHVRKGAVQSLAKIYCTLAVPNLAKTLEDQHWRVRALAAQALGEMGPAGAEAASQLVITFEDLDSRVRYSSALALSKLCPSAVTREALISVLEQADMREEANGLVLQLALSTCPKGDASSEPVVAKAVQRAILHSESEDVMLSAVKAFPLILETLELSTPQRRELVQRALRMVPQAVVQCELHRLLDTERADDPAYPLEPAMSYEDSTDGIRPLSESNSGRAGTEVRSGLQRCSIPKKLSCERGDSPSRSSSLEVPLAMYSCQCPQANADRASSQSWRMHRGPAASDCSSEIL